VIGNALSGSLGSAANPGAGLSSLTGMNTKAVDKACEAADRELTNVCEKYHLNKDFDIVTEGGAPGLGSGVGLGR
jgi:hypothetical protein